MNKTVIALSIWLLVYNCAFAKSATPADVRRFVKNANICIHLSGEWDNDLPDENKKEIEQGIERYCRVAKKQLDKLSVKYKNNTQVGKILGKYDDSIGSYIKEK